MSTKRKVVIIAILAFMFLVPFKYAYLTQISQGIESMWAFLGVLFSLIAISLIMLTSPEKKHTH